MDRSGSQLVFAGDGRDGRQGFEVVGPAVEEQEVRWVLAETHQCFRFAQDEVSMDALVRKGPVPVARVFRLDVRQHDFRGVCFLLRLPLHGRSTLFAQDAGCACFVPWLFDGCVG